MKIKSDASYLHIYGGVSMYVYLTGKFVSHMNQHWSDLMSGSLNQSSVVVKTAMKKKISMN